jgi:hypothetical protein
MRREPLNHTDLVCEIYHWIVERGYLAHAEVPVFGPTGRVIARADVVGWNRHGPVFIEAKPTSHYRPGQAEKYRRAGVRAYVVTPKNFSDILGRFFPGDRMEGARPEPLRPPTLIRWETERPRLWLATQTRIALEARR